MLITLHMFSLSVVCTLNTQLKILPFKRYTVLRQTVNGNFNLTSTVYIYIYSDRISIFDDCGCARSANNMKHHPHDSILAYPSGKLELQVGMRQCHLHYPCKWLLHLQQGHSQSCMCMWQWLRHCYQWMSLLH